MIKITYTTPIGQRTKEVKDKVAVRELKKLRKEAQALKPYYGKSFFFKVTTEQV